MIFSIEKREIMINNNEKEIRNDFINILKNLILVQLKQNGSASITIFIYLLQKKIILYEEQRTFSFIILSKKLKNLQKEKSFKIENIKNSLNKKIFLCKFVKNHSIIISKLKNFPFLIENVVYENKNLKKSNLLRRLEKKKNQLNFDLNLSQKFINNDYKLFSKILKTTKINNKIKFFSKKSKIKLNYCKNEKTEIEYKLDYKGNSFTFEVSNLNHLYNYCKKQVRYD